MFLNNFNDLPQEWRRLRQSSPVTALPAAISAALTIASATALLRTSKALTAEAPTSLGTALGTRALQRRSDILAGEVSCA